MCQLTRERTQEALNAVAEFAAVAHQVEYEPLRIASVQVAMEGLSLCETQGQRCVRIMLTALSQADAPPGAVHDAVWVLYKMARKSPAARKWILEAGGTELIHAALISRAGEEELVRHGVWLVYALDGLRGLMQLLSRSSSDSPGDAAVRAAVAWSVHELVRGEREECGAQPRPESATLITLLAQVMGHESASPELLWACCSALDVLVHQEPSLGDFFVNNGGGPLLIRALRAARTMGLEGQEFRKAVVYMFASLADGGERVAEALRSAGAVQVLAEEGLQGEGRDVEAAMWALGSLGGLSSVLEAMAKMGAHSPAVLRGGVVAICEASWHISGDPDELAKLPSALALLLEVLGREEAAGSMQLKECTKALGSVVAALAPHVPPGSAHDLDRGVEALLRRLHDPGPGCMEASTSEDGFAASSVEAGVAASAEAIGRLALAAPGWRSALMCCGALDALTLWIRSGKAPKKVQKYLFWAAAAIAGVPFIVSELRLHVGSSRSESAENAADAGLCAIIDILDDDIDGEYALAGVERGGIDDVNTLLGLVVEALLAFPGCPSVQAHATQCVGLLAALVSQGTLEALGPRAVQALLAGARRFSRRPDVVRGACSTLRVLGLALVRSTRGAGPAEALSSPIAVALVEGGASDCAADVLEDFSSASGLCDLLEDAAAALAALKGVQAVTQRLLNASPGSPLRAAGLKGLFEATRSEPTLLSGGAAAAALAACAQMLQEEPYDPAGRVHQAVALFSGLCNSLAQGSIEPPRL